jgi:hypothetical protein
MVYILGCGLKLYLPECETNLFVPVNGEWGAAAQSQRMGMCNAMHTALHS